MFRLVCTVIFTIFVVGLNISPVRGQYTRNDPPTSGPWNMEDERLKSQLREANDSIRKGPDGWSNFARKDGRYAYETGPDLIGWPEESLRPTKAEYATHAEFLKQPHVGLVRLLPPSLKVVSVDQLGKEKPAGPKVPGGGGYYSFTKLNHVPGYWADLKLSEGNLEVAFGPDVVGAITILGDVPLDSLTSDSPGVSTLATYARPLMSDRAKRDNERFKWRHSCRLLFADSGTGPRKYNLRVAFNRLWALRFAGSCESSEKK